MSVKSFKTGTRTFSMLAGNVPEHHVLIAETTVGAGGAASVTFSNIPADYQHLQIRGIARCTVAQVVQSGVGLQFNSDTGSNYATHQLQGDGANASSSAFTSQQHIYFGYLAGSSASSNVFGSLVLDILDYASTSKNKTIRSLSGTDNNGSGLVALRSGLWMSTSAISSMSLVPRDGGSWSQYSTFQLYGVK